MWRVAEAVAVALGMVVVVLPQGAWSLDLEACNTTRAALIEPDDPAKHTCVNILIDMNNAWRNYQDGPLLMGCNPRWFSQEEACTIAQRLKHIIFVGDSLTRMVFEALLMILTDNFASGSLQRGIQGASGYEHCRCSALQMDKDCRAYSMAWIGMDWVKVKWISTAEICGSKITMAHMYKNFRNENMTDVMDDTMAMLRQPDAGFLYVGAHPLHPQCFDGVCSTLEPWMATHDVLRPLLSAFVEGGHSHAEAVFATMHTIENWRVPRDWQEGQSDLEIKVYNDKTMKFCRRNGVPIFDTTAMTRAVTTLEGVHHTYATNLVKAQLLLGHMNEMLTRREGGVRRRRRQRQRRRRLSSGRTL